MGATNSKYKTKNKRHAYAADRPLPPGKPTLKVDDDNLDPDTVTIKWDPPTFDGGSKITGYLVEHKRTGSPYWVKASPLKVCQTQLTVCGLEPGSRYQFRVTAENQIGYSDPSPISEPLAIFVHKSAAIAPYFVTEICDVIALEHERIEFIAMFEGIPTPKVSWYRDGLEIFSNRCQKISTEGCVTRYIIYEATLADESEIKCSATNRVGYAVTRAFLRVEAPPTVRIPRQYEDGLIFQKGETIRLKVSVIGQPLPIIDWYHDGEEIHTSSKYEIEYADRTAVLKVKNIQRCDRGDYQIQATNELGEDMASILITIADKPQPPSNLRIESVHGTTVTLSWLPPDDDGGCKIGSYLVEYFKTSWNVWLKATTSRQLSVTLNKLIEGSEYKFRVKAENPYGVSDPSPETNVIFIPDPKRGINNASQIVDKLDPPIFDSKLSLRTCDSPYSDSSSIFVADEDRSRIDWRAMKTDSDSGCENVNDRKYHPVKPARKTKKKLTALLEQDKHNGNDRVDYFTGAINSGGDDGDLTSSSQPSIHLDDASRTSSELMLVLVPNDDSPTKRRGSYDELKHSDIRSIPPALSFSAPELGCDMQLFKPLRNCVSSTEILHESTIARFYKQLKDEHYYDDGAVSDTFEPSKLDDNFSETSQLLVNRQQRNEAKLIATKNLGSDVVSDLRKIGTDDVGDVPMSNSIPSSTYPPPPYIVDEYLKPDTVECCQPAPHLSPIPTKSTACNAWSSTTNDLVIPINNESHPQGRYSPRSGTFHYPDLFMESLTKSPKFKPTSTTLSDVVGEMITKQPIQVDSYPGDKDDASIFRVGRHRNDSFVDSPTKSIYEDESPTCFNEKPYPFDDQEWLEKSDSEDGEDDDDDSSEYDSDELEGDTYHPEDVVTPLSFEEALAISNPKRNVSPTNDMFLESETPFYDDEDETDLGLHYFNRSFTDRDRDEEPRTPKSILKSRDDSTITTPTIIRDRINGVSFVSTGTARQSIKKMVRIEEPRVRSVDNEDSSLVFVNHYGDLVKEYGTAQKSTTKRYLTYEELKAAAQQVEYEENEQTVVDSMADTYADYRQNNMSIVDVKTLTSTNQNNETELEIIRRRVRFYFDFTLDAIMFAFACWLFCFKDEKWAIPVIGLMVCRQLYDRIKRKMNQTNFWRRVNTEN